MPHECTNCGETFADGSKEMLSGCPSCGGNKFQFRPSSSGSSNSSTPPTPDESGGATSAAADRTQSNADRNSTTRSSASGTESRSTNTDAGGSNSETRRPWPGQEHSGGDESSSDSPKPWPSTAREPADRRQSPGSVEPSASSGSRSPNESDVTVEPRRSADASPRRGRSPSSDEAPSEGRENPTAENREDRAQANARSGTVSPDEISRAAPADSSQPQSADEADGKPNLSTLREELNEQFESIKIVSPGQYELNLMELYDRDSYIISLQEDGHYVIEVPETWNRDDQ
ncbi:OapC/ArvC family zinc-ribbon domain-containing protein [Haloprofundus halobius]|uniref:OapC/ArvC family zinc-ribbon domain-containing protein n=1 Tax=Haloprofundus halobius TaxID=2876194 RepID=UPI001CCCF0B8|nr:Zn-ribbon containing protein [Haloprofundus halobius]